MPRPHLSLNQPTCIHTIKSTDAANRETTSQPTLTGDPAPGHPWTGYRQAPSLTQVDIEQKHHPDPPGLASPQLPLDALAPMGGHLLVGPARFVQEALRGVHQRQQ
ncbi:hypothetical protein LZ30DRAFT_713547 [Colletotrichum cereale]|nr:hypothetical protein LZ30DRAFT_713547 [Colletotrichum cereale]